jgi:hypothetical protein
MEILCCAMTMMTILVTETTGDFNSPLTCGCYHGPQMSVWNASWHTPSRVRCEPLKDLCDL